MATQGIVSIISKGKTLIKAVAGCDGYNAKELAQIIRDNNLGTVEAIYKAAEHASFGCSQCLVVMDGEKVMYNGEGELSDLYKETFNDPRFNPRWENGTAGHIEIIEYDAAAIIKAVVQSVGFDEQAFKRLVEKRMKPHLN